MQDIVIYMNILDHYPSQYLHIGCLTLGLLCEPRDIHFLVTDESARVAASGDHLKSHPIEVGIFLQDIITQDDQDALSSLGGVSPWRALNYEVLNVELQGGEGYDHSHIIYVLPDW